MTKIIKGEKYKSSSFTLPLHCIYRENYNMELKTLNFNCEDCRLIPPFPPLATRQLLPPRHLTELWLLWRQKGSVCFIFYSWELLAQTRPDQTRPNWLAFLSLGFSLELLSLKILLKLQQYRWHWLQCVVWALSPRQNVSLSVKVSWYFAVSDQQKLNNVEV